MNQNLAKCANIGCPNKSKLKTSTFKGYIQAQNITYKNKCFPTFSHNEPYTYLKIHRAPSLIWKIQVDITINQPKGKANSVSSSPTSLEQKQKLMTTVI